ncbi:MAG: 2-isopropylmalate synthase, partial [Fibrobacter sp.]|nr:2-isopropylmalate synthase [Fibrobacter sp.]
LIDNGHIPDDTTIQVLTQAREHLIDKTFQAIAGASRTIVHLYNSTSPTQREIVFNKSPQEIIRLATDGVKMVKERAVKQNNRIILEYSPESFSQTELSFASDICNAVIEAWAPEKGEQIIINLPSTVEISSPNVYADQIEFMNNSLIHRDKVILSVHTHNDRGCAVAAAELALLAGAQRVEGTLFGNGERTGNADLLTMAMNCFSHGIQTGLDFSNPSTIAEIYSECTGMAVSLRHPYAGELVFTAFSGSHQDAISKGLADYQNNKGRWNVPYLPIDPQDIGRSYEAVIRINSQSGKGGAAYIIEHVYNYMIPREMYPEVGTAVQKQADFKNMELSAQEVFEVFCTEFINRNDIFKIVDFSMEPSPEQVSGDKFRKINIKAVIKMNETSYTIEGMGNGLIDALTHAIHSLGADIKIITYTEHSLGNGSEAKAAAYIQIENKNGKRYFGVGVDTDIAYASIKSLFSALNRAEVFSG